MPIARATKKVTRLTSVLTDPIPQFVSLVGAGANQTPFKVVKHAFTPEDREHRDAELLLAQKTGATVVEISKITFSKKSFKDIDAVRAYMDKQGYSDYTVHEEGDFYVVPGSSEDDHEGDPEQITIAKGATMHLARVRSVRKSAAEVAAEATSTATAIPASATGDTAPAETAAKSTEAGTEKSTKSIYTVSEFAGVLSSIAYMLDDIQWENEYYGDESPVPDSLKEWLKSGATIFETLAKAEVDKLVDRIQSMKAAKAAQDAKGTPPAPEAVETAVSTKNAAQEPAIKTEQASTDATASKEEIKPEGKIETAEQAGFVDSSPEKLAPAASEAGPVDPVAAAVTAAMKSASEMFAGLLAPVAKTVGELAETVKKSDERVASLEVSQRQTRKSVAHEEVVPPGTQATKPTPAEMTPAQRHAARQARNALGF